MVFVTGSRRLKLLFNGLLGTILYHDPYDKECIQEDVFMNVFKRRNEEWGGDFCVEILVIGDAACGFQLVK